MAIEITERTGAKRPRRSGAGAPGGGAKRGSYDRGFMARVMNSVNYEQFKEDNPDVDITKAVYNDILVKGIDGDYGRRAKPKRKSTQRETQREIQRRAMEKRDKTEYQNKGGIVGKKPKFMKGGSYKGKSHMYAAGGMVKELKI